MGGGLKETHCVSSYAFCASKFNFPMQATLEFYDLTGRKLFQTSQDFEKGYQEISVSRADLNASGVIYYQLQTEEGTLTRKMILN